MKNIFVFVVCGEDEHIHTLNFSLPYLKHFSKNEIIVVTDLSRNNVLINHDNIIDIDTPANLDHHQASIFLKTSLHKILNMQNLFCYLDTDVVAIKQGVDDIFNHFIKPVTFASDHCKIDKFSNNAVNCNCIREYYEKIKNLNKDVDYEEEVYKKILIKRIKLDKLFRLYNSYDTVLELENKLQKEKNICKRYCIKFIVWYQLILKGVLLKNYRKLKNLNYYNFKINLKNKNLFYKFYKYFFVSFTLLHRWIFIELLRINEEKIYRTFNKVWINDKGKIVYSDYPYVKYFIKRFCKFKHDIDKNIWYDEEGLDIYNYFPKPQNTASLTISCNHLIKEIYNKFNIKIDNYHWHHWNGGVFLFDSSSVGFMDTWHQYTMDIFKDCKWKVRDQGTLIATAWKYGLQDHKRIPEEFNFIADYYKPEFKFEKEIGFTINNFETIVNPFFVHVYYEYGRRGWDVWDYIENILPENQKNIDSINYFKQKYSQIS